MPMYPRTVFPRRRRRIATTGALALLASVSLVACEQSEREETPGAVEPATPRAGEPMAEPTEPTERPEGTAMRPFGGDEEEVAQRRTEGLESERPYDDTSIGQSPGGTPGMGAMGQPQTIEKTASVDMQTFERRLESELGEEDLTLAAAFDLKEEPRMRMFVVAPKDLGEQGSAGGTGTPSPRGGGAMPQPDEEPDIGGTTGGGMQQGGTTGGGMQPGGGMQQGGGMQPGGGMQQGGGMQPGGGMQGGGMQGGGMHGEMHGGSAQPGGGMHGGSAQQGGTASAGGSSSQQAQMALQKARLVVAYADEDRPDRVTIAYLHSPQKSAQPDQPDRKLQDAIDRAAGDGMDATPPTKTTPPPGPEERRG